MRSDADPAAVRTVCGAVGPRADDHVDRMLAHLGVPSLRRSGPGWALASSRPDVVTHGRTSFTWGRYVVDRRSPGSWQDAAHELGLAGLSTGRDGIVLHTDALGVQEVFWRRVGDVVCFADRIGPLLGASVAPLSVDLDAWGESLAFGGFVGDATGFAEIRRLQSCEVLRLTDGRARLERVVPEWLVDDDRGGGPDPEELAAILRRTVPRLLPRARTTLPLSGGWDSRLVGMLMVRNGARRPDAWTISPDSGCDDDVEMAAAVAEALGLRHQVVPWRRDSWIEQREATLVRVEHLTWLHTWIAPLAARVRAAGVPVLDGLGGDVLLRNLFTGPEVRLGTETARTGETARLLGVGRLSVPGTLDERLAARWKDRALCSLRRAGSAWSGHRSESLLRVLTLRTNRVIAASPMRLFAPYVPVILPLMTPSFVRAAIAVSPAAKDGGGYYRALLRHLDPVVGGMPSTNDGTASLRSRRRRSQTTRRAVEEMVTAVEGDPVVAELLHPRLLREIEARDYPALRTRGLPTLQWASTFASWRRAHDRTALVTSVV